MYCLMNNPSMAVVAMMLNMYSTKMANRVQAVCTVGKTAGLIVIIIGGIVYMAQGRRAIYLFNIYIICEGDANFPCISLQIAAC